MVEAFFYPRRIYNLPFFPGGKSVHYEVTKLSSEKSDSSLLWPSRGGDLTLLIWLNDDLLYLRNTTGGGNKYLLVDICARHI